MAAGGSTIKIGGLVFRIGNLLGRGGYGTVYDAIPEVDSYGEPIVVKVSKGYSPEGHGPLEALKLEAKIMEILSELELPYFPKFYGYEEIKETAYLLMSKITGTTLTERRRALSSQSKDIVVIKCLYALYSAKSVGFVHGDLIGSNIMVIDVKREIETIFVNDRTLSFDNRGVSIVMYDFGLSRLVDREDNVLHAIGKDSEFIPARDVCKLLCNPFNISDEGKLTAQYKERCLPPEDVATDRCIFDTSKSWYPVIPPYPTVSPEELLLSELFRHVWI